MQHKLLLALVVLYEMKLKHSDTIISLQAQSKRLDKLVIWDNSQVGQEISDLGFRDTKVQYIHTPENVSLAKVYNTVVRENKFGGITLLDQDSILPSNFIEEMSDMMEANTEVDLFLPIVKNKGIIMSPGQFFLVKGSRWKNERMGLLKSKGVTAVTSGMTIRESYLKTDFEGFDERLTLYGIDTHFMIQFSKKRKDLFVANLQIQHDSALNSKEDPDKLLYRWRNLKASWKIIHEKSLLLLFLSQLYAIYKSIMYAIKLKDIRFIKN